MLKHHVMLAFLQLKRLYFRVPTVIYSSKLFVNFMAQIFSRWSRFFLLVTGNLILLMTFTNAELFNLNPLKLDKKQYIEKW